MRPINASGLGIDLLVVLAFLENKELLYYYYRIREPTNVAETTEVYAPLSAMRISGNYVEPVALVFASLW